MTIQTSENIIDRYAVVKPSEGYQKGLGQSLWYGRIREKDTIDNLNQKIATAN